ncbi:MAG: inositol monophosphatase family protein [Patescibacteria group bacterium]
MKNANMEKLDFAIDLARRMGKVALETARTVIIKKESGGNFATAADLDSERIAIETISAKYPGHKILSEETLDKIKEPEKEPHLWIVDPIDGTTNFAHKVPLFAIAIAYMEKGEVVCGAVFDPSRNELFCGSLGQGAFLNGERIFVSGQKELFGALINTGCPYEPENFDRVNPLNKIFHQNGARVINISSAVLETVYVASGRFDAYIEYGPKPWDIASGKIIVEEAGGALIYLGGKSIFNARGFLLGSKDLTSKISKLLPVVNR